MVILGPEKIPDYQIRKRITLGSHTDQPEELEIHHDHHFSCIIFSIIVGLVGILGISAVVLSLQGK